MITIFFTNKEHPWSQGKNFFICTKNWTLSTNLRIRIRCGDKLKSKKECYREQKLQREIVTCQDLRVRLLVKCGPIRRMQFWAPPFSSMIYTTIIPRFSVIRNFDSILRLAKFRRDPIYISFHFPFHLRRFLAHLNVTCAHTGKKLVSRDKFLDEFRANVRRDVASAFFRNAPWNFLYCALFRCARQKNTR